MGSQCYTGIYVTGYSGGFLNLAITSAFCLYHKLSGRRFSITPLLRFLETSAPLLSSTQAT
ncbi:hypothetical protein BGZ60DRAFT_539431 [Tricladium varicosporioides]|nr:hypothetical protein BGZ60DRAFT_539431 [Hymenoscyphus varicosporioides]